MNKEILLFHANRTDKHTFHYPANIILVDDADIDKILISYKVSFGKKSYK